MLKSKVYAILLMAFLLLPVTAEEETSVVPALSDDMPVSESAGTKGGEYLTPLQQDFPAETYSENIPDLDKIQYKKPVSRKSIAKKFLLAMGGVGVSSLLLFILLSLYNKVRERVFGFMENEKENLPENDANHITPRSLTEAVRVFIDKTKWD